MSRYSFSDEGMLKGWAIGGSVRWQDKVSIGFPVTIDPVVGPRYDVTRPYYGPTELNVDGFVSYKRKLFGGRINWSAQVNVRNIGEGNKLIPISAQPDGSIAGYRIAEPMIWTLANTFKF